MAEFTVRKHATFSPTKCVFCGDTEGPFIDTHLDMLPYGHVWVCMANDRRSGCVRQLSRLDGMFDPDERSKLDEHVTKLQNKVAELKAALAETSVPVGEVLELLR